MCFLCCSFHGTKVDYAGVVLVVYFLMILRGLFDVVSAV